MANDPWVLVGVTDPLLQTHLRKTIGSLNYRSTCVENVEECAALIQRRSFLAAFFDRSFLTSFQKKHSFSTPTFITLIAPISETSKALELQAAEKIHDWILSPVTREQITAQLLRAKQMVRLFSELGTLRAAAEKIIQADATLVCAGKFGKETDRWIDQVKSGNDPLLIASQPGCRKGLIARLLHGRSKRSTAPFVKVRCSGRPAEELEHEIFGEIPPRNRPSRPRTLRGQLSLAATGTVLFDQADHLSRRTQQRLAQAISSGSFSPVGGGEKLKLDARLIFSVHENGEKTSINKLFQRELAKLLKRSPFRIPPLKERTEDLPLMLKGSRPSKITDEAMEFLQKQPWPGNLRQLEGVLWAAKLLAGNNPITIQHLAPFLPPDAQAEKEDVAGLEEVIERRIETLFLKFGIDHFKDLHPMVMDRVEKPLIRLVLAKTAGNQVRASQILGINRNTLRRKVCDYGIGR